jgi:hypothetical protein
VKGGYDTAALFLQGFWPGQASVSPSLVNVLVDAISAHRGSPGLIDTLVAALGIAFDVGHLFRTAMTVAEFFHAHPDAYFVYGGCNIMNEKGEVIDKYPVKDFNLREMIDDVNCIPCPSAFYRREVIEEIGLLDTRETGVELDYWIRVGKVFAIHRIDKPLSNFRLRE